MKLLKISVLGLPLFHGTCEIDFLALQRVTADNADKMSPIFCTKTQKYYQNNVLSFIGINASGKTSILKLITFICKMLGNESINTAYGEILDGLAEDGQVTFEIYFYTNNETVNFLHTVIRKKNGRFIITEEYLKSKPSAKVTSKTDVFNFDESEIVLKRNNNEAFLLDDVSIMVAFNKTCMDRLIVTDMLRYTNMNELSISEDCPPELIAFFDPSIEYLHVQKVNKDTVIRLKFHENDEITLNKITDLNRYLSSGTIKGINIFVNAVKVFGTGGYLIIDELENHFNREIVSTLIRFYMDSKINPRGAMLVFSTHYSELLDEFERNDNIYIVRNNHGISAENLSSILKRNDMKKSEAYQSGYLKGTVPMYDAYMSLKKSLIHSHREA